MKIGNKEVDFDVLDMDNLETYRTAMGNMTKAEVKNKELLTSKDFDSVIDGFKNMYSAYKQFFIDCLGIDVLGDIRNIGVARKMVLEFNSEVAKRAKDTLLDK